jgi:Aminotransferase class I and II
MANLTKIASYVGMEDSLLYAACFDANGGLFEPLFGDKDAIVSDSLNHASIIDGVRLSKATRFRYANGDMDDLETQLKTARENNARRVAIVTDGVFPWTAISPNSPTSADSQTPTARSSWSTTATPPASSAIKEAARRLNSVLRLIFSQAPSARRSAAQWAAISRRLNLL